MATAPPELASRSLWFTEPLIQLHHGQIERLPQFLVHQFALSSIEILMKLRH